MLGPALTTYDQFQIGPENTLPDGAPTHNVSLGPLPKTTLHSVTHLALKSHSPCHTICTLSLCPLASLWPDALPSSAHLRCTDTEIKAWRSGKCGAGIPGEGFLNRFLHYSTLGSAANLQAPGVKWPVGHRGERGGWWMKDWDLLALNSPN